MLKGLAFFVIVIACFRWEAEFVTARKLRQGALPQSYPSRGCADHGAVFGIQATIYTYDGWDG